MLALTLPLLLSVPAEAQEIQRLIEFQSHTDTYARYGAEEFGIWADFPPEPYPRRVAIVGLNVNYERDALFADAEMGAADYAGLTDVMLDRLRVWLAREGFEVAPHAAVLASPAYAALPAQPPPGGDAATRFSPAALKPLALAPDGTHADPAALGAVAKELGVDAVVTLWAAVGSCSLDLKKEDFQGEQPCIVSPDGSTTGFRVDLITADGTRKRIEKPVAKAKLGRGLSGDPPIVHWGNHPTPQVRYEPWGARGQADALDYRALADIDAIMATYDAALAMGFAAWGEKSKAARAAAGVERDAESSLQHVPPLPGQFACWGGKGAIGEWGMRAGWDPETRTGYLQSNVLTLSPMPMNRSQLEVWRYDGDTAKVHDLHGSTTGTARVTGPPGAWTGFVEDLKVDGGAEIHVEATVEEGALRLVTTVDGEAPIEQRFPALEGQACEAWLGRSPPVPDWPLGH